ncbi:MAG TPA: signal peptidase I [Candidatus Paceibacterota bacterium]|nr:signal peptidase I [Candidatus Paceibacterota bacterium]
MDQPLPSAPKRTRGGGFFENVLYVGAAIGLALLIQAFIARPFIVSGSSMDPSIKDHQYLIVDEISYRFHEPQRGDVIVFKAPPEPTKYYIKRIIGLPGDTVSIHGTTVTITDAAHPEGFTLKENFITHPQDNDMTVKVPADSYFVMGDNRAGSYDSRSWGMLPKANIRGRALLRLFPLSTISYLPAKVTYDQ